MAQARPDGVIEMAALGRPFALGSLYDCRDNSIIPGMTLWDIQTLGRFVDSKDMPATNYKFEAGETFSSKSEAMGADVNIQLSIMSGAITVGCSGKYLYDDKTSSLQERMSLHYNRTTKNTQLSMDHLGTGNVQHPDVFDRDIATHVVTGMQYGARAIFVFEHTRSIKQKTENMSGKLKAVVAKLPLTVRGSGHLTRDEQSTSEHISCTLYSEGFKDVRSVTTFKEAVDEYRKLSNKPKEDAVPITVYLLPLSKLEPRAHTIVRQISIGVIEDAMNLLEKIKRASVRANDLLLQYSEMKFPERIETQLRKFLKLVKGGELWIKGKYSVMLPDIRRAAIEEQELVKFLELWSKSKFSPECLDTWIKNVEHELNILQSALGRTHEVATLLATREALDIRQVRRDELVCLVVKTTDNKSVYLSDFDTFVRDKTERRRTTAITEAWYSSDSAKNNLAQKIQIFDQCAIRARPSIHYVVVEKLLSQRDFDSGDTPGAVIKHFKGPALVQGDMDVNALHDLNLESRRPIYACGNNFVRLQDITPWDRHANTLRLTADRTQYAVDADLNTKVSVWRGDITRLEVDAIVNTASDTLLGGCADTVDHAIHSAAGPGLKDECSKLNGCKTGEAKVTGGHNLPAEYVIHTVGPPPGRDNLLRDCYRNSFKEMEKKNIRSIAVPCISTGIHGFPEEDAAHIALRTTRDFLENNRQVQRIIFCVFRSNGQELYERLMQVYFPVRRS